MNAIDWVNQNSQIYGNTIDLDIMLLELTTIQEINEKYKDEFGPKIGLILNKKWSDFGPVFM